MLAIESDALFKPMKFVNYGVKVASSIGQIEFASFSMQDPRAASGLTP